MKDPIKQMLSAMLAAELAAHIAEFEENDGGTTWLRAAAQVLHPNDLKALVSAAKSARLKYLKDAAGCPPKVSGWGAFFDKKETTK